MHVRVNLSHPCRGRRGPLRQTKVCVQVSERRRKLPAGEPAAQNIRPSAGDQLQIGAPWGKGVCAPVPDGLDFDAMRSPISRFCDDDEQDYVLLRVFKHK